MQPGSSVSAPQRDGSESLIEETELGLSLGGEKAQQRGASPRVKERPLGAFVQKKNLGQGIGMGPNPELSFGLSCLTKAQGALVGSEGSFRRLEGVAQTLPSVERVSQRMEGTPRELQISVEDVRLVLEQRNPQVFDALGAIIMNDALLEEAARFTGFRGYWLIWLESWCYGVLSTTHCMGKAYKFSWNQCSNGVTRQDRSMGKTIGRGRESQGLYHLTSPSSPAACISTDAPLLIHSRLGHPSLSKFQKMVPRFSTLSSLACESCQLGKHTRVSFPKRLNNRAKSPFEHVHTDVWGPCRTTSTLRFQYFVTFIDNYSRCTWLFLMKNRAKLFSIFQKFYVEIQTQFNVSI
ncbi:uncharacterized protein LOC100259417 isoform X2 [Vitis vinifera]|uniref:uncharacterized protein LOC100259417 isoform X2 n=1 Tax=Vitis vinifera TaxID=29760 RepID=UPI0028834BB1|nr:uncharacterized protein LOC100259417 isoform X2 [Vitis vinifera]